MSNYEIAHRMIDGLPEEQVAFIIKMMSGLDEMMAAAPRPNSDAFMSIADAEELAEDSYFYAVAEERLKRQGDKPLTSFDDVLKEFGRTQADIDAAEDWEIE